MQAYARTAILSKLGKVVTFIYTRGHVAHERKTLQIHGFPIQTYGKHVRGYIFNSKV